MQLSSHPSTKIRSSSIIRAVYRDAQFSDEATVALGDIHLRCCCCSAGPLWSWGHHQTLPITKHLRYCEHTTRKESQSNTTWRINSRAKRSVDRQLCTCCNITNVPNPQSFFLSSKGINKGQVRATRSTEQNTLLTDGEIQPSTPEHCTWTLLRCHLCASSNHFHVPGMNQVGFVAQNVPDFYMFISWCSDKAPFNLTAEFQTWRKHYFIMTTHNLTRRQTMIHKTICSEIGGYFCCLALR